MSARYRLFGAAAPESLAAARPAADPALVAARDRVQRAWAASWAIRHGRRPGARRSPAPGTQPTIRAC